MCRRRRTSPGAPPCSTKRPDPASSPARFPAGSRAQLLSPDHASGSSEKQLLRTVRAQIRGLIPLALHITEGGDTVQSGGRSEYREIRRGELSPLCLAAVQRGKRLAELVDRGD